MKWSGVGGGRGRPSDPGGPLYGVESPSRAAGRQFDRPGPALRGAASLQLHERYINNGRPTDQPDRTGP